MARCKYFKAQTLHVYKVLFAPCQSLQFFLSIQYILVTVGDIIIASSPAPLCDGESHEIEVTISGNETLLLVDGQPGRREDAEVPFDLLSQSSTFIGGLPGESTHIYIHISFLLIRCLRKGRQNLSADIKPKEVRDTFIWLQSLQFETKFMFECSGWIEGSQLTQNKSFKNIFPAVRILPESMLWLVDKGVVFLFSSESDFFNVLNQTIF